MPLVIGGVSGSLRGSSGKKGPVIQTPRGAIYLDKRGKAKLVFNSSFQDRFQNQYSAAQRFIDSEVLGLSERYIPLLTGTLIKSGILGTDIGSGLVQWIAPYARVRYYVPAKKPSAFGSQRGILWFERMKQAHGKDLILKARKMAGGG